MVVGSGPAGRAVSAACADAGLHVVLVAPAPRRVWANTYAAWPDELPPELARRTIAARAERVVAIGTTEHEWHRPYAVLDNTALWQHLWRPDVEEVIGKVATAEHAETGSTVVLTDGRRLATAAVVDASGAARALSGGRPARTPAHQTAVGVIVRDVDAEPLRPHGTAVFMNWRQAPDTRGGWPTFLYGIPVSAGQVLLEETSLARRPALPLAQLRRRLHGRLAEAGVAIPDDAFEERVRFPVDDPLPKPSRVIPFGATAGLIHPASGFSVAASLRLAPWVAGAIAAGLPAGPSAAARAAWSILWPSSSLAAHEMRRRALGALLSLPPDEVPAFFEQFFGLDERHRRAFLSPVPEPSSTVTAMASMFRDASWTLRSQLITGVMAPRRAEAHHGLGGM